MFKYLLPFLLLTTIAASSFEPAQHEENEEMLFHAAMGANKPQALHLFKKIARSGGSLAGEAAYQWMLLLAEDQEWEMIFHERKLFTAHLTPEQSPLAFFYLGRVSFEKGLFLQAASDLQKCLGTTLTPQQEKEALLTLLACANTLQKWELAERTFDTLATQFPESKSEAIWMLASGYHQGGNKSRAFKLYDDLCQECPATHWAEKSTLAKTHVLMGKKKYDQAHELVLSCIDEYPLAERKTEMVRLAIHLSLARLAEESVYEELAQDLERGLSAQLFVSEEKIEKELLLAKAYLKLGRIPNALHLLQAQRDPDAFLLTQCYLQEGTSPEKVVEYGEQALLKHPSERGLHLHLFNAYLDLFKEHQERRFTRKAAEHLAAVVDIYPVTMENHLWLIHYWAKEDPHKAIPLLETLLQSELHVQRFAGAASLLAALYKAQNHLDKAEHLLKKINGHDAKLKLAEIYSLQGNTAAAQAFYEELEKSAQLEISFLATLKLARLDFVRAPEKSLKKLHALAERKSLSHEPIHLEAALDYADLKASLYPASEQPRRLLELLIQVKMDFTEQNDMRTKDYHANFARYPEKQLIYQAYMRYLDARIYELQAALSPDPNEGRTKRNASRALFSSLRQGKYAITPYIIDKAALKPHPLASERAQKQLFEHIFNEISQEFHEPKAENAPTLSLTFPKPTLLN